FPAPGLPSMGTGWRQRPGLLGRARDRLTQRLTRLVFDSGLEVVNATRRELSLPPLRSLFDQPRRADRLLVCTSRSFDFPADAYPPNVRFVGPQLDDPAWSAPLELPWKK